MKKPKHHRVLYNVGERPYLNERITADLIGGDYIITGSTHHLEARVKNSSDSNFEGKNVVLREGLWKRLFQSGFFENNGCKPRLNRVTFYLAQDQKMRSIAIDEVNGQEFIYSYYSSYIAA